VTLCVTCIVRLQRTTTVIQTALQKPVMNKPHTTKTFAQTQLKRTAQSSEQLQQTTPESFAQITLLQKTFKKVLPRY